MSWGQKPIGNNKWIREALSFERALHRWDKWLNSIELGRKLLCTRSEHPSLEMMKNAAQRALSDMGFSQCAIFELYWLCCVFTDYGNIKEDFEFEKLIVPDWFPLPFGFQRESEYQFKRDIRVYPPEVWTEAERKFFFEKELVIRSLPLRQRVREFASYPDRDFTIVLPADHPVRKHFKKGRPLKTDAKGKTLLR
jgi:hypothetical protein